MILNIISKIRKAILDNKLLLLFSFELYLASFLIGLAISFNPINSPIFEISNLSIDSDPTTFLFIERNGSIILSMIFGSFLFGMTSIANLLLNGMIF